MNQIGTWVFKDFLFSFFWSIAMYTQLPFGDRILSRFVITSHSLLWVYICSVAAATTDESGALGACQSEVLA